MHIPVNTLKTPLIYRIKRKRKGRRRKGKRRRKRRRRKGRQRGTNLICKSNEEH